MLANNAPHSMDCEKNECVDLATSSAIQTAASDSFRDDPTLLRARGAAAQYVGARHHVRQHGGQKMEGPTSSNVDGRHSEGYRTPNSAADETGRRS